MLDLFIFIKLLTEHKLFYRFFFNFCDHSEYCCAYLWGNIKSDHAYLSNYPNSGSSLAILNSLKDL